MYAGVKARDYLIGLGYDGVDNYGEEFIAFEPNQIKSATDNIGTFDSNNPDIRFRSIICMKTILFNILGIRILCSLNRFMRKFIKRKRQ